MDSIQDLESATCGHGSAEFEGVACGRSPWALRQRCKIHESGLEPFDEWAPEEIGRTFFSLDELARQVRARIIVKRLRIGA